MQAEQTLASARWKILKRAVLAAKGRQTNKSASCQPNQASVRRFSSFNLFQLTAEDEPSQQPSSLEEECGEDYSQVNKELWQSNPKRNNRRWFRYAIHLPDSEGHQWVTIKHLVEQTSLEAMMGFNNTGNVCVWPSEEVMAYYCLVHGERFRGKTVCELGCGMTGLAGVMLAQTQLPAEVVLTDGNAMSVSNISDIIEANVGKFGSVSVSCDVLVWDQSFLERASEMDSKFDFVICADCLFFEELHVVLVKVIQKLLKPGGRVLIFAPPRAGSLDRFIAVASQWFIVQKELQYDKTVWEKHEEALRLSGPSGMYSLDLHFPLLLTLSPTCMQ